MKKTGRILIVAELAKEYGFKDVGGMWTLRIGKKFQNKYHVVVCLYSDRSQILSKCG